MVALVLEALEGVDDLGQRGPVEGKAQLLGLELQRGLPGQLGHHETGAVAHRVGRDVLVGVGPADDGAHVQARLVGERRRADVRLLGVEGHVDQLGHVVGHGREALHAVGRDGGDAHLQGQVGDDSREVAVARPLAIAVDRALHVGCATAHARQSVGHAAPCVVMGVHADADVAAEVAADLADDAFDLVRHRPPVGVAEHEGGGALLDRTLEHAQAELGVALVAVEEVLGVEEHDSALAAEEPHRVGDHGDALVECGLECLEDVVVPALADDAHGAGAGLEEVAEGVVGVDLAELAPRRAEGHQRARVEAQLVAGPPEELVVLGVGARPAALDVVDAQPVELLGDAQLVVDGEGDALQLAAVAEGGVEDLDGLDPVSRHVRPSPCTGRSRPGRWRSTSAAGSW